MKKSLILALFISFTTLSFAQNKGVGFRLGDPLGLTFKIYNEKNAYEFNIGRTYRWGRYGYDDAFYRYSKYDKNVYEYTGYGLASVPISIQFHYLINKDIPEVEGLNLYFGFGPQVRFNRVHYTYRYKVYYVNSPNNWYWDYGTDDHLNLDIGLDGVFGAEYKVKDVPVSFFLDFGLMMEVWDAPFAFWGQGGLGVRYRF